MKLTKIIAVAVIAASATYASAQQMEIVTSNADQQILVKNNFGECVTTLANRGLTSCGDTPTPQQPTAQTEVISLDADAYFDTAKADLKPAGQQAIQELARQLNSRGANVQKITVVGNTDSRGSDAYNQKLSERRAASVGNYLIQNGVPASLISAYGNGERNPIASNDTAEGRQQNRRVDIAVEGVIQK